MLKKKKNIVRTMVSADFCHPLRSQTSHGKHIPFLQIVPDLPNVVTEDYWASHSIA